MAFLNLGTLNRTRNSSHPPSLRSLPVSAPAESFNPVYPALRLRPAGGSCGELCGHLHVALLSGSDDASHRCDGDPDHNAAAGVCHGARSSDGLEQDTTRFRLLLLRLGVGQDKRGLFQLLCLCAVTAAYHVSDPYQNFCCGRAAGAARHIRAEQQRGDS